MPRAEWLPLLAVALLSVTGWHMFSAFSLVHMGGGRGAIVAFTMPIWAALFSAWFLKERFEPPSPGGSVAGHAGHSVPDRPGPPRARTQPDRPAVDDRSGHLLGRAASWFSRVSDWSIGIFALTGWQLLMGGAPIVLAWLVLEPHPDLSRLTWAGGLATLYAATVALIFCFAAHNKVVTLLPATAAAISTLAIPVVGLLSSAWLLGEPVGWREVAGAGSGSRGDCDGAAARTETSIESSRLFAPNGMLCAHFASGYNAGDQSPENDEPMADTLISRRAGDDRTRALDAAISQIERAFGKGSVMRLGAAEQAQEIETVSTGSLGPRHRARRRRPAARPDHRDLRARELGQDHAHAPRHRRGAEGRRQLRLHRRRARARPVLRQEARRQSRRPADQPARHRRAGARDRRHAGPLAVRST